MSAGRSGGGARPAAPASWSIGADVGGTFVDVVACAGDGALVSLKHPRRGASPAQAVLDALRALLAAHRIDAACVARIVHGSTIVTNLLLERDAPPVAVLTTRGFRDVLALARQDRRDLYHPAVAPPTPQRLFPRALRFEIGGRVDAAGNEIEALDEDAVLAAAAEIGRADVAAVAVCLLFAHRRPEHERRVRELLRQALPACSVSLSCEVDPAPREFERSLVTALDAYARPGSARYLAQLAEGLARLGLPEPQLVRSAGGVVPWREAGERPIALAMSGPCAALLGVAAVAGRTAAVTRPDDGGEPHPIVDPRASRRDESPHEVLLSIDVGGTSTDIGLVAGGRPAFGGELDIGGLAVRLRCADVTSLPLGGGSVAQVNAGGGLRLGPQSQGANPGPACYGGNGERATLSDALMVLGRLPAQLAGGLALDAQAAREAIGYEVAGALGVGIEEAAQAVVSAAAVTIAEGVKQRLFERGLDPAGCLLVAGGGGGAQHVAEAAQWAGIARAYVLPHAGVIAALGLLDAAPTQVVELARDIPLDDDAPAELARLAAAATPADWRDARCRASLELRYEGQQNALEIDFAPGGDSAAALRERFDAAHEQRRGHAMALPCRVSLLRLVFEREVPSPRLAWPPRPVQVPASAGPAAAAPVDASLPAQGVGPRALFAPQTTVWVPAGWCWRRESDGGIWLERCARSAAGLDTVVADTAMPDAVIRDVVMPDAAALALEPLRLGLQGVVDRMQSGMVKSAHSSIAREGGDCAAALFLPDGRLLAQARSLPLLLGSLIPAVAGILSRWPAQAMADGDGYLMNDPWSGGTHLPDLFVLRPVVDAGRTIALAACCLHHQDVGGASPGSVPPHATDVLQEGLRLPPLRWRSAAGPLPEVEAILYANTRTPANLLGDLGAQWAAVSLGARETAALARRFGDDFAPACEALIAQAESMTRAALASAPDGDFRWHDALDGDGVDEQPVPIEVLLAKRGDSITIDFSGSAPQTRGPVNASPGSMMSAALFFMRSLAPDAPNNAGCLAPLRLVLPEGSVVNPRWPAALNARTATVKLACNAILGAWAGTDTGISTAANAGVATVIAFGGRRSDGSRWFLTEIVASGAGASALADGVAGISTDVGNARNTPAETIEADAPIRIDEYAIRDASGGGGSHRGGDGVRRVYRLLDGTASVAYRGERHASRAQGVLGGGDGASSRAWIERVDGSRRMLAARAAFEWHRGERLVVETAGAGGWGQPLTTATNASTEFI